MSNIFHIYTVENIYMLTLISFCAIILEQKFAKR